MSEPRPSVTSQGPGRAETVCHELGVRARAGMHLHTCTSMPAGVAPKGTITHGYACISKHHSSKRHYCTRASANTRNGACAPLQVHEHN